MECFDLRFQNHGVKWESLGLILNWAVEWENADVRQGSMFYVI